MIWWLIIGVALSLGSEVARCRKGDPTPPFLVYLMIILLWPLLLIFLFWRKFNEHV